MSYWMGSSVRSSMMRSCMSGGMHWSMTVAKMRVDAISILMMAMMGWICVMHVIIMVSICVVVIMISDDVSMSCVPIIMYTVAVV